MQTLTKVASDYYKHFYGGIARDIQVTYEGMLRFFDVESWDFHADGRLVLFWSLDVEVLGAKKDDGTYVITFID